MIDWKIKTCEYKDRTGNLNIEASGVVKSQKFFPTFMIDGENYIFKPLSKTKPLTLPTFAFAEVFWSYVINKHFVNCPQYQLAICNGYEEEVLKYYNYGTLVPNILNEKEHLVNLLEYFRENPDENVDINEYVNYCMLNYDYVNILESKLFKENKQLGEDLALQVLLSVLKADQNFHYENISFVCDKNNNILRLAPMIDHEFSTMFLFFDNKSMQINAFIEYLLDIQKTDSVLHKNILYIKEHYPNVFHQFINGLYLFKSDLEDYVIGNEKYLFPCNSFSYKIGETRFKEKNEEKAKKIESETEFKNLDISEIKSIVINTTTMLINKIITTFKYEEC